MIEITKSREGDLTAKSNNIFLHSAYSPKKEASKLFKSHNLGRNKTIILLAPCLNYIAEEIRINNNSVKIISVYIEDDFYSRDNGKSDSCFCFSSDESSLQTFLRGSIHELDIESLKIFEWPPSVRQYKDTIFKIRKQVSQVIRELHGNITTISGFGQKCFKNFIRNYLSAENYILPQKTDMPILIAGSGPGLKNDIDFIRRNRKKLILLALPSSLYFLRYNQINPDLIVSTDPGYYAAMHLNDFKGIPVAAPLSASLPHEKVSDGHFFFRQNHFFETSFPDVSRFISLPQNGTVAGSSLYLATALSTGPILISGLDFSYTDMISHNRPHTFDNLLEKSSSRFKTLYSIYFNRNIVSSERLSGRTRTTHALKTYSGWFTSHSTRFCNRCFFLNTSNIPGNFNSISYENAESLLKKQGNFIFSIKLAAPYQKRIQEINTFISGWVKLLEKIVIDLNVLENPHDFFCLLNNDIIFNFFLPELLEYKRHFINKNSKEARDKAVSLTMKAINFFKDFNDYV